MVWPEYQDWRKKARYRWSRRKNRKVTFLLGCVGMWDSSTGCGQSPPESCEIHSHGARVRMTSSVCLEWRGTDIKGCPSTQTCTSFSSVTACNPSLALSWGEEVKWGFHGGREACLELSYSIYHPTSCLIFITVWPLGALLGVVWCRHSSYTPCEVCPKIVEFLSLHINWLIWISWLVLGKSNHETYVYI